MGAKAEKGRFEYAPTCCDDGCCCCGAACAGCDCDSTDGGACQAEVGRCEITPTGAGAGTATGAATGCDAPLDEEAATFEGVDSAEVAAATCGGKVSVASVIDEEEGAATELSSGEELTGVAIEGVLEDDGVDACMLPLVDDTRSTPTLPPALGPAALPPPLRRLAPDPEPVEVGGPPGAAMALAADPVRRGADDTATVSLLATTLAQPTGAGAVAGAAPAAAAVVSCELVIPSALEAESVSRSPRLESRDLRPSAPTIAESAEAPAADEAG